MSGREQRGHDPQSLPMTAILQAVMIHAAQGEALVCDRRVARPHHPRGAAVRCEVYAGEAGGRHLREELAEA